MTISDSQMETFQTKVSRFTSQSEPNTCLPVALVNIIGELADRKEFPEMKVDLEEVKEMVDHDRFLGSTSEFLPERINPHLEDFNYQLRKARNLSMDGLNDLIESPESSYPVAELDRRYFDWIDADYHVTPGMHGEGMPHTVIPFSFNDETVLLFDPYQDYFLSDVTDDADPIEVPQPLFYEWWSGESTPRWAVWVEEREQYTLDSDAYGRDQT